MPAQAIQVDWRNIAHVAYAHDPVLWAIEVAGAHLWSKQREILYSIRDNRRTAVATNHRFGKSHVAGIAIGWWNQRYEPGESITVTTAPGSRQVKGIIWREFGRRHAYIENRAKVDDSVSVDLHSWGRVNQQEWYAPGKEGKEELVAYGRKPADYDQEGLAGIYNPYPLVIVDESTGISETIWGTIESLMSNENARLLALGNPLDRNTYFGEICKPGSGWNVIQCGWKDTPNYTGEIISDDPKTDADIKRNLISKVWVDETITKFGINSPYVVARVFGQFPESTEDGLISPVLVQAAIDREPDYNANGGRKQLGVDVGAGGDKNVICYSHGNHAKILSRDQIPDTMATLGNVIAKANEHGVDYVCIDENGVGRGAADRAKEQHAEEIENRVPDSKRRVKFEAFGVNVGRGMKTAKEQYRLHQEIKDEDFANLRSYAFWSLREDFEQGLISLDPDDVDLHAQLVSIKYHRRSTGGRIAIQRKEEMISSPDDADALALARLKVGARVTRPRRTRWGRQRAPRMRRRF